MLLFSNQLDNRVWVPEKIPKLKMIREAHCLLPQQLPFTALGHHPQAGNE